MTSARPGKGSPGWAGSRRRIARRLPALAAILGVAFFSIAHSVAGVIVRPLPQQAMTIYPYDGRITAAAAERAFVSSPGDKSGEAAALARKAVRQDATAVRALTVLLYEAQLSDNVDAARRAFGISQELSRRELRPQLWAIEDSVVRGDLADALRHYDLALSTSASAPDVLFPVLAQAIAAPAIRQSVSRMIASGRPWGEDFVDYLADDAPAPEAAARLFREVAGSGIAIPEQQRSRLIDTLVEKNQFEEARRVAEWRGPRPNALLRNGSFDEAPRYPSVFDWALVSEGGLRSSLQGSGADGSLEYFGSSGSAGTVAQQLLLLPPGTYRLEGESRDVPRMANGQPYWVLKCLSSSEAGRIDVPPSATAKRFSGAFTVSQSCPQQNLALNLRATRDMAGQTGRITGVDLKPISRSND